MKIVCVNCGTALPEAARFCWNCGHPQAPGLANPVCTLIDWDKDLLPQLSKHLRERLAGRVRAEQDASRLTNYQERL
ncbi:MAG: zinc-ribbon domain-containing protein, partial [Bacteroidetes bacterium]